MYLLKHVNTCGAQDFDGIHLSHSCHLSRVCGGRKPRKTCRQSLKLLLKNPPPCLVIFPRQSHRSRRSTNSSSQYYFNSTRQRIYPSKMTQHNNFTFYLPSTARVSAHPSTTSTSSGVYSESLSRNSSLTSLLDMAEYQGTDESHFNLDARSHDYHNDFKTNINGYDDTTWNDNLVVSSRIQLRFLNPGDYEIVKQLCEEWFPVEYPAKWFEAITSDTNLFSLAASIDGKIVGLIVSELKNGDDLSRDDRDLLCDSQMKFGVSYILSLGVVDQYRRRGIASLLLSSLLNHLSTMQCKAVYLHVLTSNERALHFYEKHNFRVHKFLPYYYSIGGKAKDGFTYVLYINGGHGPWGFCEYIQHVCEVTVVEVCSLPRWCVNRLRKVVHATLALIR